MERQSVFFTFYFCIFSSCGLILTSCGDAQRRNRLLLRPAASSLQPLLSHPRRSPIARAQPRCPLLSREDGCGSPSSSKAAILPPTFPHPPKMWTSLAAASLAFPFLVILVLTLSTQALPTSRPPLRPLRARSSTPMSSFRCTPQLRWWLLWDTTMLLGDPRGLRSPHLRRAPPLLQVRPPLPGHFPAPPPPLHQLNSSSSLGNVSEQQRQFIVAA